MANRTPYINHFSHDEKKTENNVVVDINHKIIKDFDQPINLMIACSALEFIEGGFEDVLKHLSKENH